MITELTIVWGEISREGTHLIYDIIKGENLQFVGNTAGNVIDVIDDGKIVCSYSQWLKVEVTKRS